MPTHYPIHDAEITSLRLSGKRQVTLSLVHRELRYDLIFDGVFQFNADGFTRQNVVFELKEWRGEAAIDPRFGEVLLLPESDAAWQRVRAGELALYELLPSIGCWFVCIAESCRREAVGS